MGIPFDSFLIPLEKYSSSVLEQRVDLKASEWSARMQGGVIYRRIMQYQRYEIYELSDLNQRCELERMLGMQATGAMTSSQRGSVVEDIADRLVKRIDRMSAQ